MEPHRRNGAERIDHIRSEVGKRDHRRTVGGTEGGGHTDTDTVEEREDRVRNWLGNGR